MHYVHNDHLATPQVVTTTAGNIRWRATAKPFGDASISPSNVTLNVRYPGQYFDSESGLHYNYFRYYEPDSGRYVTSDPIGLAGGLNTYAYANSNPVGAVDPFGLVAYSGSTNPLVMNLDQGSGGGYRITSGVCRSDGTNTQYSIRYDPDLPRGETIVPDLTFAGAAVAGVKYGADASGALARSLSPSYFSSSASSLAAFRTSLDQGNFGQALKHLDRHYYMSDMGRGAAGLGNFARTLSRGAAVAGPVLMFAEMRSGEAGWSKLGMYAAAGAISLVATPAVGAGVGSFLITLEIGGATNDISLVIDKSVIDAID